jgi:enolase
VPEGGGELVNATTSVTITDLAVDDVRLCREPGGTALSSLAVAACHIDLTLGWSRYGRSERIAALEKLSRMARQAAHELRAAEQEASR